MISAFNPAMENIPESGIRRIFDMAVDLNRKGKRIYPFHIGMPSFDTPEPIKAAAIDKLQRGYVHYTPNAGIPELRTAIAEKLNQTWNTSLKSSNVIVTVGACEAISIALMTVVQPGGELLVLTPCWLNYLHLPRMMGIRVVELPQMETNAFLPNPEEIESRISTDTKAILINSPSNPTGSMLSKALLERIIEIARRHNIWIIYDEVYEAFVYDEFQHVSILPYMRPDDLIISIGGFSKTYSMTGWRLGYVISTQEATAMMLKAHQYLVTSACSFAQWGALTAVELDPGRLQMQQEYQKRRDIVINALCNTGMSFVQPQGAFYVFPQIPDSYPSDEFFCHEMITKYGLGFVPGSVFGKDFDRYFRLCYACSTEEVQEGMEIFIDAIQ